MTGRTAAVLSVGVFDHYVDTCRATIGIGHGRNKLDRAADLSELFASS